MRGKGITGLTDQLKEKLLQQALESRLRKVEQQAASPRTLGESNIPEQFWRFHLHPGYQQLRILREGSSRLGLDDPFFREHEGIAGATTEIGGKTYLNFSNYNYLDLTRHPEVQAAAKAAIERYGTSVSASRIVSGERPVHEALERALANCYGVDAAIAMVSGHATNVTTIGYLFGPRDLIVHDALIHNSALQGMQLSGARRLSFPHNDWQALDHILERERRQVERVLIVLEGLYSMDGDFPDLPRFIEVKRRHRAFLLVDEAHSFGVMGTTGKGIREHFGLKGEDVDIWMGTLSKTLAGCGGYIAGENALIEHLKFMAPGFLYSVGMAPPLAAAALAALHCLYREPERVATLQARGKLFLELAQGSGIDVGFSTGLSVIPAITGSSIKAAQLSSALFARGMNVQPILYPAVPEKSARLRFFLSCAHSEQQIRDAVSCLVEESRKLRILSH